MKVTHLSTLCALLSLLVVANANYGRRDLIRPTPAPQYSSHGYRFYQGFQPIESRFSPQDTSVNSNVPQDIRMASTQISQGSEKFSFEMFISMAHALQRYDSNFVIAPFSVWSLMLLIAEGATATSFNQLQATLRMPNDMNTLRTAYKNFQRLLLVNTSTVELAVNQALFSDINRPIENSYATILSDEYEADHLAVNFKQPANAVKFINDHIDMRTHGKIKDIVKPEDLIETQLLLTSAIFFKGQWKFPFNISYTKDMPFYREDGKPIGNVPMMSQRKILSYTTINQLDASILELPYGKEDRLCMLLILPRYNSSLAAVFQNLRNFNIATISYELHKYDNTNDYDESEIELTLPRFSIDSDLELRTVLEELGIKDIFDPAKANLSKMSKQPSFVSRVFHKAVIEVNEQGTVAAGVTAGTVSFKQSPIEFIFNRPFGFLITDKVTNTLLFAGQVKNPLVLQYRKMYLHHRLYKIFTILLCIFHLTVANIQSQESIVFPTTYLQRQKSFDLLSNNTVSSESIVELSRSAEAFSIEYFQHISRLEVSKNNNLIISPFSIWSLLLLLAEGSSGRTYEQLSAVLRLPNDLTKIRRVYKYIQSAFLQKNTAIELITNQVLFSDINRPIDIDFQDKLERTYEADHFPVDFTQTFQTVTKMNSYVKDKTKGKIERIIDPVDVYAANLVLISAIFFQGRWKDPFKLEDTRDLPFYNENGVVIGNVPMMFRKGGCSHIRVPSLEADIIELAYGFEQQYSMVIFLPFKQASLIRVIDNLRILGLQKVIENLNQSEEDPDLEINLPRFSISSDFKLNSVLQQMGLKNVFDEKLANFLKISKHSTYVSQFIQKAVIDVNENGTIAAAANAASLSFQSIPLEFHVNRPFAFMIIERTTNTILFCGNVKNPLAA
ncbi:uncharacterized protein LOC116349073 [Contarinia nasturtii]|uniref:uncharacterized protein LOC116349073 n=1 Tax=Contarinia nasturtii TaxID=265458 RepID=UPI0012D4239F|nr:uncharacterized protein LOC116349073 [Contarinia nasturtii]